MLPYVALQLRVPVLPCPVALLVGSARPRAGCGGPGRPPGPSRLSPALQRFLGPPGPAAPLGVGSQQVLWRRARAGAGGKQVPAWNRCRRRWDRGDAWGKKSSVFNVPDSHLFLKTTRQILLHSPRRKLKKTQKGLNSLRSAEGVGTNTVLKHFIKNIYC